MADAMCRLAAGGGFGIRENYSDDEEILLNTKRPIIINGIDDLLGRADPGEPGAATVPAADCPRPPAGQA